MGPGGDGARWSVARMFRQTLPESAAAAYFSCIPSPFFARWLNPNFKIKVPVPLPTVEVARKPRQTTAAEPRVSAARALPGESSGCSSQFSTIPWCWRSAKASGRQRWPASHRWTLGGNRRRRWLWPTCSASRQEIFDISQKIFFYLLEI